MLPEDPGGDLGMVRSRDLAAQGILRVVYETLLPILPPVDGVDILLGRVLLQSEIAVGQDAPHDGDQMGDEGQIHAGAGEHVHRHLDLGDVAVRSDAVRYHACRAVGVMRPGGGHHARSRGSGFGIDHDVVLHKPRLHQGGACEDRGCGVASGVGHEIGTAYPVAEELRKTVYRIPEVLHIGMVVSVPLLVELGIVETVVPGQVDGLHPLLQQGRDLRHGHPMGGRHEHQVEILRVGYALGEREVYIPFEIRMDL